MRQTNVWHANGCSEKGGYLGDSESGDTTSNLRDVKGKLGMADGKGDKSVNVWFYRLNAALHGGYGIRITLKAITLSPDGPESIVCGPCRSPAMMSGKITSEDKNVIRSKSGDVIGSVLRI